MNETLKRIIEELEATLWKSSSIFGYHKDFFNGLSDDYELRYNDDDPDYPVGIERKNYNPSYVC